MRFRIVPLSAALLTLGALQGCGKEGETTNAFQESIDSNFNSSFATSFVSSCKSAGIAKGIPAGKIEPICKCASDELLAKYDAMELASLSISPDKALPIMKACAQKFGFMPRPKAATGAP